MTIYYIQTNMFGNTAEQRMSFIKVLDTNINEELWFCLFFKSSGIFKKISINNFKENYLIKATIMNSGSPDMFLNSSKKSRILQELEIKNEQLYSLLGAEFKNLYKILEIR